MLIIKSQWQYKSPCQLAEIVAVYTDEKYHIKGVDRNNVVRELGYYKDAQRAKEVMEEIEEHIRNKYVDKCIMQHMSIESFSAPAYELIGRITKEANKSAIYSMPKE